MTIRGSSGLSSLAMLNRRLILQASDPETSTAEEETDPDDIFQEGADEEGYRDPDEEADDEPEVRGRFASENPLEYNRVKEWIELNIFGGSAEGQAGLINAFVNEWDVEWRTRQGLDPEDDIGTGATLDVLLGEDDFLNGAMWLPATGTNKLPPVFRTEVTSTDEEGNETVTPVVGIPDPLTGVQFVEETTVIREDDFGGRVVNNRDIVNDLARRQLPGLADRIRETTGETDVSHFLEKRGLLPGADDPSVMPEIPMDDLVELIDPTPAPSRRGGGSRTSTRRDIAFDKDQLVADVADKWNRWMLSADQAPTGRISSWVDEYVNRAQAFWSKKGGQLDFDTFITGKLRADPRYQTIYKDKTPGESEEQFVQRFMAPIGGLGQSSEFTRAQTERAITSGGGPAAQFDRVRRTREVQVANAGELSQRMAQTLAGIGVG